MSIIKKREKKETKNTGKMVVLYPDLSSKTKRLIERVNDPETEITACADMHAIVVNALIPLMRTKKIISIDVAKMRRDRYEKSEDLKLAAILMAYRRLFNFLWISDKYASLLAPTTKEGIKIWNDVLLSCRSKEVTVMRSIEELLIGEEAKHEFSIIESVMIFGSRIPKDAEEPEVCNKDTVKNNTESPSVEETQSSMEEIVDPAEAEYPEEDVEEEKEVVDEEAPTLKKEKMFSFAEALQHTILFDDSLIRAGDVLSKSRRTVSDPYAAQNTLYESQYTGLSDFTTLLLNNGYHVVYDLYPTAVGNLICASVLSSTDEFLRYILIDPNLLYRNGTNVLTASSEDGNLLDEAFVPITDTETILMMAKKRLNQKERRAIQKRYPSGIRNVFNLIDFTGLGNREPLPKEEWEKLITILNDILKNENIKFRTTIMDYFGPDKFRLLSDSTCAPLSYDKPEEVEKIRKDGSVWINYDLEKYAEKQYEIGSTIPEPQAS